MLPQPVLRSGADAARVDHHGAARSADSAERDLASECGGFGTGDDIGRVVVRTGSSLSEVMAWRLS